jgi:hypothetical protein
MRTPDATGFCILSKPGKKYTKNSFSPAQTRSQGVKIPFAWFAEIAYTGHGRGMERAKAAI